MAGCPRLQSVPGRNRVTFRADNASRDRRFVGRGVGDILVFPRIRSPDVTESAEICHFGIRAAYGFLNVPGITAVDRGLNDVQDPQPKRDGRRLSPGIGNIRTADSFIEKARNGIQGIQEGRAFRGILESVVSFKFGFDL